MATKPKAKARGKATIPVRPAVMSCRDAAALLNITPSTLHYHIRHGRIHRVTIPGAKKALGVSVADIRAILSPGTADGVQIVTPATVQTPTK